MDIISIRQANKAENGLKEFFNATLSNVDLASDTKLNDSEKQQFIKQLILALNRESTSKDSKNAIKNIRKLGTPTVLDNSPYYAASNSKALEIRNQELDVLNALTCIILSLVMHATVAPLNDEEKQRLLENTYEGIKTLDALPLSLNKKNKLFLMFNEQYVSAANFLPELLNILYDAEKKYSDELYNELLSPFIPGARKTMNEFGSILDEDE